jgi:hypothetical protein
MDLDLPLAGLEHFLAGAVAAHLGGRRVALRYSYGRRNSLPSENFSAITRDFWCSVISVGTGSPGINR